MVEAQLHKALEAGVRVTATRGRCGEDDAGMEGEGEEGEGEKGVDGAQM